MKLRMIFPNAPRFKTKEDAALYHRCLGSGEKYPQEKWIHPWMMLGDHVVRNPEYEAAPFEERFIYEQ